MVSMTDNVLVMINRSGKECCYCVTAGAKFTQDGVPCKAADLKAGYRIRVTLKRDNRSLAVGIESLDKNIEFAMRG